MIKSELAQRIARKNRHLYQVDAEKIVDAVLDSIVSALARRERVELRGFGTFSAKVHPARSGRNPKTGGRWLESLACLISEVYGEPG